MELRFTKMHGLGNDFVIADLPRGAAPPAGETLRRLANRRTGIGFDQLLLLEPPRRPGTEVYYRIFNADGDEVEQCGNGARCIAQLLGERKGTTGEGTLTLDSAGGLVQARIGNGGQVSVNMGVPRFAPRDLPFEATTEAYIYTIEVAGTELEIGAVSIGNPHAVLTVPSVESAPVDRIGPALERHPRFPRRTNVEFMEIVDAGHIRLRVHERGTGETRACGTGACAAVAVGRRHGVLGEAVAVDLPGGRLAVQWAGPGEPIWMTGPAEKSFEGTIDL
ncbi:MAG TPA: diaminopimelate epimerase [Gammaproteobacteria bacterium]|nr:diaminopimelate epimerase [Gammaproteobacteria bacterium]